MRHAARCLIVILLLKSIDIDRTGARAESRNGTDRATEVEDLTIIPGFGTKRYHLDMRSDQFGDEWKNYFPKDLEHMLRPGQQQRGKADLGVEYRSTDGKVTGMYFYFRGLKQSFSKFPGKTDRSIDGDNSIEDVIHAYGQPDVITATHSREDPESPGVYKVELGYYSKGISFFFDDERLTTIIVAHPVTDFNREIIHDMGDVGKYRAIRPNGTNEGKD